MAKRTRTSRSPKDSWIGSSPSAKKFDHFVYPNRDHGLSEGKGSTLHVRMLIARYLIEHLPPGPR